MKCQFCSIDCLKGQTVLVVNEYWQDFTCYKCNCTFTLEKKHFNLIKYIMYVDKYRLDCNLLHNTFNLGIFDNSKMARYDNVYTTNFIPNLTPQNALEKIKTILVFL